VVVQTGGEKCSDRLLYSVFVESRSASLPNCVDETFVNEVKLIKNNPATKYKKSVMWLLILPSRKNAPKYLQFK